MSFGSWSQFFSADFMCSEMPSGVTYVSLTTYSTFPVGSDSVCLTYRECVYCYGVSNITSFAEL